MDTRKIHCPICHGTGKINDTHFGSVACLNCEGTGIVFFTREQQIIVERIKEKNRIIEFENEKKRNELLRAEKEKERITKEENERLEAQILSDKIKNIKQQELIQQKEQTKNIFIALIVIVIIGILILIIFLFWDDIATFFINVFKFVFLVFIGLSLIYAVLSAYGK